VLASNALGPALAEQLAADRVELASRIIGEVGAQPGSAGEVLYQLTVQAIEKLLRDGNPSSQVKMLWACKNLESIDYYRVAENALNSPVRWVQNQALIVAAQYDSLKRGISDEFISQISYDLILSRFLSRAPTYLRATLASGDALLKRHVGFAFVSVLFSLTVSAAGLAIGYRGSFFTYAQMAPLFDAVSPSHHEKPPVSGGAFTVGDDLSVAQSARDGKAPSDAALPADGQVEDKGASVERDWGDSDFDSNDRPDWLRSFFGGLGPRPTVPYLMLIVLGSLFYFCYRREKEIELVVLGSGAVGLALAFAGDQFMRGNIIAVVPIAEFLIYVAVPLCILTAALIRIGSMCVYAVGAPGRGGRRAISSLLAKTMAQTTSGKITSHAWRLTTRFWKDLVAAFAGFIAPAILAVKEPSMRWPAVIVAVLVFVGWCTIRRDLVRTALAWVRTEGSWTGFFGLMVALAIFFAVVGGGGYGAITAQSSFPVVSQYIGIVLCLIMVTTVAASVLLILFEQPLRKFYFKNIIDLSDLERWSVLLKRTTPHQQAVLLDNVDHQYFRVTSGEYYDAIVRLESVIKKEPALSIYWRLRHEIEAVQRQQRGEE
jgi:hypothetical protein